jgi:hypothetical protein
MVKSYLGRKDMKLALKQNLKAGTFDVPLKGKISVIRNTGFYQKIIALRIYISILELGTLFSVNGKYTLDHSEQR